MIAPRVHVLTVVGLLVMGGCKCGALWAPGTAGRSRNTADGGGAAPNLADAVRRGDEKAVEEALNQGQNASSPGTIAFDADRLRAERPLHAWLAIYVKRNQLIASRFYRSSSICPRRALKDRPVANSVGEFAEQLKGVGKDLWKDLRLDQVRATPLHLAALFCQPRVISLLLEKGGANPGDTDDLGLQPLHWASCSEVATALLAKADPNARSEDGFTPLHLAVDRATARVLIRAGAKTDVRDACGNQPLHTATYFGLRARRGGAAARPAEGDGGSDEEVPLWLATLLNLGIEGLRVTSELVVRFDVYGELLAAGADAGAVNELGMTPDTVSTSSGGYDD